MTRERVKDPELEKKKAEEEKKKQEEKKEEKPKRVEKSAEAISLVRLVGTDLNGEKKIIAAIKGIKGVSHSIAKAVCTVSQINPKLRLKELNESQLKKLEEIIKDPIKFGIPRYFVNRQLDRETGKDIHFTGSDLTVANKFDVQRYIDLKTYRGWRYMLGQPVRGQRTRSHFRQKGRVVGVMRKAIKLQMGKTGEAATTAPAAVAPKAEAKKEEKK